MRCGSDAGKLFAQEKYDRKWGAWGMRYPACEKPEVIRTVEGLHLPVRQTLDMLCLPRSTFYRWYDLYVDRGLEALTGSRLTTDMHAGLKHFVV